MKRVLIITYYWPPTGGSGVQRWVKFAKYLPSQGWQPVIYTPQNPEQLAVDGSLVSDVPECAEVLKTRITEPYGLYRKFVRLIRGDREVGGEVNPLNSQHKGFAARLAVLVRGNCFIPDPRAGWVRPSVTFLSRYLREHPVDAIVTTGPPHSMHLIGLGLMKILRKELSRGRIKTLPRWTADFRDPWTEMFYFKHMGLLPFAERKHRRLEQQVLDGADTIIAVTPMVQEDFQKRTTTPVSLVTNGFDEDDFQLDGEPQSGGKFVLVHTGLFADDGNPVSLWNALASLCSRDEAFAESLEIWLAGKVDGGILKSLETFGLKDRTKNLGYLPHRETVARQCAASILLLPLRQEPEYRKVLPGKIFEYLAAGRPVLGIGQEDGAAAAVLRDSGAGEMFDWDRQRAMEDFIYGIWQSGRNGKPAGKGSNVDKYSRKALTGQLVKIL